VATSKVSECSHVIIGCLRALFCIVFPPLAVLDQGCGSLLIVFALTLCGWMPGALAAVIITRR
jgi:uncharacterized membrane protein YqaE (UPF0057 family)